MVDVFGLPATLCGSLVFFLGTIVGSFLNVVALRWEDDRGGVPSFRKGGLGRISLSSRSHCPYCHTELAWYELIPILSFLVQGGRCRHCKEALSWRYVAVELLTGAVFLLIVLTFGLTVLPTALLLVLASLLLIALLVDLQTFVLPDLLTALALLVGLLLTYLGDLLLLGYTAFSLDWHSPIGGFGIALLVIGGLYVLTRGRGMGLGDVKLAPVLGLTLGGPYALIYLFVAFLTGALVGVGLIASGRASMKTAVPFGPFLIWGWFVAIIWGPQILTWYTAL